MDLEAPKTRPDGLQISDDPAFQRGFWRVERLAWLVFAAIIVLALLGLTGSGGPLSQAKLTVGPAEVTYTRIMRWQTSGRITVSMADAPSEGIRLGLSEGYSSGFSVDGINPQPEKTELFGGGHLYQFSARPGAQGPIVFDMTARAPGVVRFHLTAGDQTRAVTVWVLP